MAEKKTTSKNQSVEDEQQTPAAPLRTFDWRSFHDPKSRNFPVTACLTTEQVQMPVSNYWPCTLVLDQGAEGRCVGCGHTHEAAAEPNAVDGLDIDFATKIYNAAKEVDEFPGDDYSGTSVLAGAKVMQQEGYYTEYRWSFGVDDLVLAIGHVGPVVLGIPWFASMYDAPDGKLTVSGDKVGGHCILANGVNIERKTFTLHNSWGAGWGNNGEAEVSWDDMAKLLADGGEAMIAVERVVTPAEPATPDAADVTPQSESEPAPEPVVPSGGSTGSSTLDRFIKL